LHITVLGSGTSHGIPVIGCHCEVCTSTNPKNKRTRSSIWLRYGESSVLIDTATDLRLQAVGAGLERLDAILFTHPHADHVNGLDEVRRFNELQGIVLPCYGQAETLATLRRRFSYIWDETQLGGGKPQLELRPVEGPFEIGGMVFAPIEAWHGRMPIWGYRFGRTAYLTDASAIPDASMALLEDLDLLILNTLRRRPHPTHFSLEQSLAVVAQLKPRRAYFTHLSHDLEHEATNAVLPPGVELAYDGLQIEVD
jgi:phosphoribosyl 1,2-cyclic phosphate phosphodiesterase